jgi:hypothetical protein
MGRLHLFELEDQAWFPRVLRDAGTAFLALAARVSGHAAALAPRVEAALAASGEKRIVDLCSGGGGPIAEIVPELARRGVEVQALLTDFFPNEGALAYAAERSGGRIAWSRASIDATRVPRELAGLRTIFNALHHFRPGMARAILADAAAARRPIAIFEVVSRDLLGFVGVLGAPIFFALALPFLRPFRWIWVPLTYLVPVLPLFVLWDGVVSCLRIYSTDELAELVASLPAGDRDAFAWEIGRQPLPPTPARATFLVGIPRT